MTLRVPNLILACLALTLPGAIALTTRPPAAGAAPSDANPQERTINATIWMRRSAEYDAICLQTYHMALRSVCDQYACDRPFAKPPAVILDLDETVFDQSAFQLGLIAAREPFSDKRFDHFIANEIDKIRLVPGAKRFIKAVEAMGITVHYISNRPESSRAATIRTLKRLDIDTSAIDGRLFLKTDSSNKEARRQTVRAKYAVLVYVGDSLTDFNEAFDSQRFLDAADPTQARADAVAAGTAEWGTRWFVLPNPVYGNWTRLMNWDAVPH